MRFTVPGSSWSLDSASNNDPAIVVNIHKKRDVTIRNLAGGRVKAKNIQEDPRNIESEHGSQPLHALQKHASKILNTKAAKLPGLRKRVSKFFTGPHNASIEPRRCINEVTPAASFSNFILLKLLDNTRQPARLNRQPTHTPCLAYVRPIYDDGSSIANYSTPRKYSGSRDETCSQIKLKNHNEVNMQLQPIARQDPFVTAPIGAAYSQTVGNFPSEMSMSDQDVFDSRNGRSPVRGLYRNGQMHHERLIEEQLSRQAIERRAYEIAVEEGDNDWATEEVKWDDIAKDLLKVTPGNNKGAQELAALNPGYRGGVIFSSTPFERSFSQLTATDTHNASRKRQRELQPSISSANADAEFHAVDDVHSFGDPISSDPRDVDLPRAASRAGRGHLIVHTVQYRPSQSFQTKSKSSTLHTSIIGSDAFDQAIRAAALGRQAAAVSSGSSSSSSSLPLIPTGSDIISAAATDPSSLSTPIAFRACFSDCPAVTQSRPGRMVSTRRLAPPLLDFVQEYVGAFEEAVEDADADAVDPTAEEEELAAPYERPTTTPIAPFPVFTSATSRILHLVHTLESQRDELTRKNRALLVSLENASSLIRGAEAAYDEADVRNAARIKGVVGENRELRERLEGREEEFKRLRKQFEEGLGELFDDGVKEA